MKVEKSTLENNNTKLTYNNDKFDKFWLVL